MGTLQGDAGEELLSGNGSLSTSGAPEPCVVEELEVGSTIKASILCSAAKLYFIP